MRRLDETGIHTDRTERLCILGVEGKNNSSAKVIEKKLWLKLSSIQSFTKREEKFFFFRLYKGESDSASPHNLTDVRTPPPGTLPE